MLKLYKNKMFVLLVSVISIVIFAVCFFYQFEVDYSSYKRIERIDRDGFNPDAYVILHTEKEFLESAVYKYHGSNIKRSMNLDFDKYSYVIVYGAKVKRMYYSVKSTLFDDKSPYYCSAIRNKKFCLFIDYQAPDNYMYIYQIDKTCMLKSLRGIWKSLVMFLWMREVWTEQAHRELGANDPKARSKRIESSE